MSVTEQPTNLVRFRPPGLGDESRRGTVFNVEYSEYDGLTYYVEDSDGTKYQLESGAILRVVQGVFCPRCDGAENYVNCLDDLCHARGYCIHGDNTCPTCDGDGVVTEEFREEYIENRYVDTDTQQEGRDE